jgi:hypothetical protein
MIKIPYAFSKINQNLVYVEDVPTGKNCDCYCITCGEDLIAKNNGKMKDPHFAHKDNSECESRETMLHYLTKHVFEELNEIYIPEIYKWVSHFKPQLIRFPKKYKTNGYIESDGFYSTLGKKYPIKNVKIETRLDDIVPDIYATIIIDEIEYDFLIEIAVTHFIDSIKERKIKEKKLNCIEIDVSQFIKDKSLWNKESIKEIVLNKARFQLINENFIDYQKLKLDYEISILQDGYVTNYNKNYLLEEEFFLDKNVWEKIKPHVQPYLEKEKIKKQTELLKLQFEMNNIKDFFGNFVPLSVPKKDEPQVIKFNAQWSQKYNTWYTSTNNENLPYLMAWIPVDDKFKIKLNVSKQDENKIKNSAYWNKIRKIWYIQLFESKKASFLPYPVIENNAIYFKEWISYEKMNEINKISVHYIKDKNKMSYDRDELSFENF